MLSKNVYKILIIFAITSQVWNWSHSSPSGVRRVAEVEKKREGNYHVAPRESATTEATGVKRANTERDVVGLVIYSRVCTSINICSITIILTDSPAY